MSSSYKMTILHLKFFNPHWKIDTLLNALGPAAKSSLHRNSSKWPTEYDYHTYWSISYLHKTLWFHSEVHTLLPAGSLVELQSFSYTSWFCTRYEYTLSSVNNFKYNSIPGKNTNLFLYTKAKSCSYVHPILLTVRTIYLQSAIYVCTFQ